MPAPVAPAPVSTRGHGGRTVKAAASPGSRPAGPTAGGMAALRRSRLQFLLDIAQATFNQPSPPTPAQIDALRRTLSAVPLEELGLASAAHEEHHSPPSSPEVDSSSSSRSSSPSLTDPPHALLGRLLEEEEAAANAAEAEQSSLPRPPITYLLIYEDERVSLGIFCLPARARIPLHNHPGMTVLSRVLYGEMHVSSYDWVPSAEAVGGPEAAGSTPPNGQQQQQQQQPEQRQQQQQSEEHLPRPARVVLDRTLSAADPPVVLFPRAGGNIHQFTAITDCAVLDLMSPPYSTEDGRDCTYYSVVPGSVGGGEPGAVLLDAYEPPADFVINQGRYCGVQPRPKLLPLFAGTSLFPGSGGGSSASGRQSPTGSSAGNSAGAAAPASEAAEAVPACGSPSPPPSGAHSPASSPTSAATGMPSMLAEGSIRAAGGHPHAGSHVYDCAASAGCTGVY